MSFVFNYFTYGLILKKDYSKTKQNLFPKYGTNENLINEKLNYN